MSEALLAGGLNAGGVSGDYCMRPMCTPHIGLSAPLANIHCGGRGPQVGNSQFSAGPPLPPPPVMLAPPAPDFVGVAPVPEVLEDDDELPLLLVALLLAVTMGLGSMALPF